MLVINHEPLLSERTTLRLGGRAIAELRVNDMNDVEHLEQTIKELGGEVFVLGGGSNILAPNKTMPITLLKCECKNNPEILEKDGDNVLVKVGGGVRLPKFLGNCLKQGLSGLEGLAGIPGTVGGAIAMNAGSYGNETCAALHSLTIYTPKLGITPIGADDFTYSYRKFSIKNLNSWFLVLDATFSLTKKDSNGIKEVMFLNFFKKKSTQPVRAWSAGCVFKNPSTENPAGKLLDVCGFKGKGKGGMRFSPMHANFLINEGQGHAEAAFELIAEAEERVFEEFGIRLRPEVKILWQQG